LFQTVQEKSLLRAKLARNGIEACPTKRLSKKDALITPSAIFFLRNMAA